MKITIITTSFNSAKTIANTLDSVAAQLHPDVEHIVVDGASTDGTQDAVRRHGRRVTLLVSEPDQGIYDAMNKGVRLSTGDIIGFLNADDVYKDVGVLARVSSIMESEGLDALYGDVEFFSPDHPDRCLRRYRSKNFCPERIAWGWMPAHPALFLQRRVFENFGLFKTNYRIAGDFELVARIFYGDTLKYRYVSEVLVRMQAGGISTGGWRNTILLNMEVLRACRENCVPTSLRKILSKYPAKLLEFILQ